MIDISEDDWAYYLGVTQGTLNNIINSDKNKNKRPRHFPLDWVDKIQRKAGCRCISQYFDLESRGMLYRQRQKETELTTEQKAELWDREHRRQA